jgi:peptidoglycan/LPS O-acetylase OafA/YrhL
MVTRLDALTGLRIFAALWVVLFHFKEITPNDTIVYPVIEPLVRHGQYGVDLFFVLSGFILSHVYFRTFAHGIRRADVWSFISYRFARLYPVHLVTFLMMAGLFVGERLLTGASSGQAERFSWQSVLATLTMTHAWFPGIDTPNLPAWSISAEWFAYLLFPFLCLFVAKKWGFTIALAVVGVGFGTLQAFYPSSLGRIVAGFLVGMAAYQLYVRIEDRIRAFKFLGVVAAVLILIWCISSEEPRLEIGLLLFALLIVALANDDDWLGRVLSVRFLVYLGEVSYAVYMFHWVARVVVRVGLERAGVFDRLADWLVVSLYVGVTIAGAIVLYHFVEKPGRKWLRALSRRSSKDRARPTVSTP